MAAKGTFEIEMTPQDDASHPAGRMLFNKAYSGGLNGSGTGQMISKRLDNGAAIYFAVEEFKGSVSGSKGSFTLLHRGHMDESSESLDITVLEGSGRGDLRNISGSMMITRENGGHQYEFRFDLQDPE